MLSTSIEHFWNKTRDNMKVLGESRSRNFWLFESSVWFHMLANSLISIYIPILMLGAGFELSKILLFYVIFHAINAPTNILAQHIIARIGARKTIIIATLFQIAFFTTYAIITPGDWTMLILLGVTAAVYDALYYTGALYLFMKTTTDVNNSGKNTGILYAVIRSASLVGPIIGSAVLLWGGSQLWVICAVIFLFICSIIPLFHTSLEQGKRAVPMGIKEFFQIEYTVGNHLSLALYKIHESINSVLWPIFIFLYFGSLESVALLAVMVPIVALVFSYFSGKINLQYRYHAIAIGALLMSVIWIGRIFIENGTWYYVSVVLAGLFVLLMQVPIDANLFRTGNQTNPLTASAIKNAVSMGTKAVMFFVLWLVSLNFESTFAIAGTVMIILVVINIMRLAVPVRAES